MFHNARFDENKEKLKLFNEFSPKLLPGHNPVKPFTTRLSAISQMRLFNSVWLDK